MIDMTASSGPSTERSPHPRTAPRGRLLARWVLILIIAIGSYTLGRGARFGQIDDFKATNENLLRENAKLNTDNTDQAAQIASLKSDLRGRLQELEAIRPLTNTYPINANQGRTVANGLLTIGLVGAPRKESIDLNINSKQYTLPAGGVITVAPDPSTKCRIEVISFDIFIANINARCDPVKP